MARHLITSVVVSTGDDDALIYVKGYQKREWLKARKWRGDNIIETLNAHYKDIESLNNLDVVNTMRCNKHELRIVHYKIYLKYLNGGHNARKKFFKIKVC